MSLDSIIEDLISRNIFKTEDGRDLWEASLPELQQLLKEIEERG